MQNDTMIVVVDNKNLLVHDMLLLASVASVLRCILDSGNFGHDVISQCDRYFRMQ